jgi:hypothetical protein
MILIPLLLLFSVIITISKAECDLTNKQVENGLRRGDEVCLMEDVNENINKLIEWRVDLETRLTSLFEWRVDLEKEHEKLHEWCEKVNKNIDILFEMTEALRKDHNKLFEFRDEQLGIIDVIIDRLRYSQRTHPK